MSATKNVPTAQWLDCVAAIASYTSQPRPRVTTMENRNKPEFQTRQRAIDWEAYKPAVID